MDRTNEFGVWKYKESYNNRYLGTSKIWQGRRFFFINCDASKYGEGSVLSQLQYDKEGKLEERIIAYNSKCFSGAQLKCTV